MKNINQIAQMGLDAIKSTSNDIISSIAPNFSEPRINNAQVISSLSAQDLFSCFTAEIIKAKESFVR